jgi:hypothetical protein
MALGETVEVPANVLAYMFEQRHKIQRTLNVRHSLGKMGSLDPDLSVMLDQVDILEKIWKDYTKKKDERQRKASSS